MAKLNTVHTCTCCGSDVTAPQFFNGKIYGYTCINKVAPKGTKKAKTQYVQVEMISDGFSGTGRIQPIVKVEGKKYRLPVGYASMEECLSGTIENAGGHEWKLVGNVMLVELGFANKNFN